MSFVAKDIATIWLKPKPSYLRLAEKFQKNKERSFKMENNKALIKKKLDLQKLLAPAVLVILYVFFAFASDTFFSLDTAIAILNASYYIGFLAIGVTFIIITGGIDLSLGTVMMCGALIGGYAYNNWGVPILVALLIAVTITTLFGFMNGIMVAKLKLPPFIATLGTQMISMGLGAIATKVVTQRYPTVGTEDGWFKYIFYNYEGFPTGVLWLFGFLIIANIILTKTRLGRYTFAMGSNEEAARLSGVNVSNWKLIVYTLSGFFVGMGGIVYAAAYTSIIPSEGAGIELLAISGVVIGGTSMSGGQGSLVGTMIGVFMMSVLRQGLLSVGLQSHWQTLFTGIVVVGAVLLDNYRIKKTSAVKKV